MNPGLQAGLLDGGQVVRLVLAVRIEADLHVAFAGGLAQGLGNWQVLELVERRAQAHALSAATPDEVEQGFVQAPRKPFHRF